MSVKNIQADLRYAADKSKAEILKRFFKTGPGQYGEGDKFLGVIVPEQRQIAKKYFKALTLKEAESLLHSPYHEDRLTALIMLVLKFQIADEAAQKNIFELYLKNSNFINNWDLVDLTAPNIIGVYTFNRDRKILYRLVKSKNLWERRIAILATFYYIKQGEFDDSLKIAEILLADRHDLIHKAVGWMLREIGKRQLSELKRFLDRWATKMPRTMLRYAIERLQESERKRYLSIKQD